MKTAKRLNLLSMPQLREEIALGRATKNVTKVRMVAGYAKEISKCVREDNFTEAVTNASKLAGILRAWEVKERSEKMAMLRSSAAETATTPVIKSFVRA